MFLHRNRYHTGWTPCPVKPQNSVAARCVRNRRKSRSRGWRNSSSTHRRSGSGVASHSPPVLFSRGWGFNRAKHPAHPDDQVTESALRFRQSARGLDFLHDESGEFLPHHFLGDGHGLETHEIPEPLGHTTKRARVFDDNKIALACVLACPRHAGVCAKQSLVITEAEKSLTNKIAFRCSHAGNIQYSHGFVNNNFGGLR